MIVVLSPVAPGAQAILEAVAGGKRRVLASFQPLTSKLDPLEGVVPTGQQGQERLKTRGKG